ncbi:MAG TPA: MFS transporter [Bryobacteraceae bacterium]|nr:MFS transporter [Bryobacteraceae bacterium]
MSCWSVRLLRNSDFLKLWTGQTISQIGSRITREGLPLTAVVMLGATPFQMGIMNGASGAVVLACGLFAGAWADRLRRRPILIVTDLGRAAVLGMVPLLALLHRLAMPHLYAIATAAGVLTVLFDVSYQAYLPSLVERENLLEGNSRLALSDSIAEIAGPGLTGVLVQWMTAPLAILFDAVSFLCSAFSMALIRKREPQPAPAADPHIGREIRDGLQTCWRHRVLRAIAARTGVGSFFMGFIGSMYILFAMRELKINPALLGAIIAVGGASSLLGALVAEPLVKRIGYGPSLIGAAALTGAGALLVPLAHGPVIVCAMFMVASQMTDAGWTVYSISEIAIRQSIVPDRLLGRVNSAMQLLFRGIYPAGAFVGGAVAQRIGVRNTMLAGAVGILCSNLFLVLSPVRTMKSVPQSE